MTYIPPIIISLFKETCASYGTSQFKESHKDIACKCPFCGDSKTGRKQRLHLYTFDNAYVVNCFNDGCSIENLSFYKFLKLYNPTKLKEYQRMFGFVGSKLTEVKETTPKLKPKLQDSQNPQETQDHQETQDPQETQEAQDEKTKLLKFLEVLKTIKPSSDSNKRQKDLEFLETLSSNELRVLKGLFLKLQ